VQCLEAREILLKLYKNTTICKYKIWIVNELTWILFSFLAPITICCHVLMHDTYMYNKCNDRYRFRNDIEKKKVALRHSKLWGIVNMYIESMLVHLQIPWNVDRNIICFFFNQESSLLYFLKGLKFCVKGLMSWNEFGVFL
jgi:hypothetical protein